MTVKEEQFQNEVVLLKQSLHRVSKRLALLENFVKTKFKKEFVGYKSKTTTTSPSTMRDNLLRVTEKKGLSSSAVKVTSKPATPVRTRSNKPYPTAEQFSAILSKLTSRTRSRGGKDLKPFAQNSQNRKEVTKGQSQSQKLEHKREGESRDEQRRIMETASDDDDRDGSVILMDIYSSDNSDTEPKPMTLKTEREVRSSSPNYQPEHDDELDRSDPESVLSKPKQKNQNARRGRKVRFEYPANRKCPICDKQFKDARDWKTNLRNHMRDHTAPRSFECDQCSKAYTMKKRLNFHKKLVHGQDQKLNPRTTRRDSKNLKSDDDHDGSVILMDDDEVHSSQNSDNEHEGNTLKTEINVNPSSPDYQPDREEESESDNELQQSDLPKRQQKKDGFKYPADRKCPVCNKEFKDVRDWKTNLRNHVRDHTAPKSFECDQCSKAYTMKKRLNWHKKLCHNQDQELQFKFKCHWCDKKFLEVSYRARHELVHTKERPNMCEICGKSFGQESALKIHKMRHTSSRDFLCSECGKAFMTPYDLSYHKKQVHSISDKPCPICDRKFNTDMKLKDHMKRMHEGWTKIAKPSETSETDQNHRTKDPTDLAKTISEVEHAVTTLICTANQQISTDFNIHLKVV